MKPLNLIYNNYKPIIFISGLRRIKTGRIIRLKWSDTLL